MVAPDGAATGPAGRAVRSRPTLASIAREAGVSLPTVSKVLNGWADVAPDTRRRIEALLEARGYVRRASSSRSAAAPATISLVIDSLNNSWAAALLDGVEQHCHRCGVALSVEVARRCMNALGTPTRGHAWLDAAITRGSRGILLALVDLGPAERARLDRLGIPYVVIDPVAVPPEHTPSVGATNWAGGVAATEHLIALGHRRIGVIGGPPGLQCTRARVNGYRAAMATAGLPVPDGLVRYGDFSTTSGAAQTLAFLDLPDPPGALFVCGDTMALGTYRAAAERSVSIPQQLSIVGFDDRPESHWVTPRLTTVHQPLGEMARTAVDMLCRRIRGDTLPSHRLELATTLKVRDSTAAASHG